jgi:hypothetical protein
VDYSSIGTFENMDPQSQTPPPARNPKKPVLLLLGVGLILLGMLAPRPLSEAARNMEPGALSSIAFIAADALRVCFFGGVVCLIIGVLRSRKR